VKTVQIGRFENRAVSGVNPARHDSAYNALLKKIQGKKRWGWKCPKKTVFHRRVSHRPIPTIFRTPLTPMLRLVAAHGAAERQLILSIISILTCSELRAKGSSLSITSVDKQRPV
jgi:hypothetical protein